MGDETSPSGNGHEKVVAFKRKPVEPDKIPDESQYQVEENARIRTNLMALVVAAVLVLVGWLLVRKLGETTRVEDCLMSGRTNCAPIAAAPREE